jgi:hypothetical protein
MQELRSRGGGLTAAAGRIGPWLGLAVLPVLMFCLVVIGAAVHGTLGMDFVGSLLHGGRAILDGDAPYHPERIQRILEHLHRPVTPAIEETAYPPIALLAISPLALVPQWLAILIVTVIWSVLPALALRSLGVTDWRCYGAAYLSLPVIHAISLGNTAPVILLCLALCWRWRDHALRCGLALAVMLSVKLIAFPLLVWLVATRRFRAAAAAVAFAIGLSLPAWLLVGFDQVHAYASVLRGLSTLQQDGGYSISSFAWQLGLPGYATALTVAVTALLLVGVWRARKSDDGRAFALATLATLAALPILHQLYFALLLVPIAISSPGFSRRWLLLLPFWVFPYEATSGRPLGLVLAALVVGIYLASWKMIPSAVRDPLVMVLTPWRRPTL